MTSYIIGRIIALVPVLLVVAIVTFGLIHITPGDPATAILGDDATIEQIEAMRTRLGLDRPLPEQFIRWISRAAIGDFGNSIYTNRPVLPTIVSRLEPTALLTLSSLAIAILIGIPAGIAGAVRRNSAVDQSLLVVTLLGVSIPNFWLGLNLILLFAVAIPLLPVAGYVALERDWTQTFRFLLMPAFALGFSQAAIVARITRTSMLEVFGQDYIRTARSKGLRPTAVTYRHALRNAMINIITVIGVVTAVLLSGSVVVETVFSIPGIGRLMIDGVQRRDYPVVQGVILFIAGLNVVVNLLVDLSYALLDPRVRYA